MPYLYVAEGERGLIKIGMTTNPAAREKSLRQEFARRGEKMVRMVPCTGDIPNARGPEWYVARLLSEMATPAKGREWFTGVPFDDACRLLHQHAQTSGHLRWAEPTPEDVRRRDQIMKTRAELKAARKVRLEQFEARKSVRRAIRQFRATVCERIAHVLAAA